MFLAGKLNTGSFVILVRNEPTRVELQRALDAQEFLGRLRLDDDPIEVASEIPTERLWSGWLEDREVAFKIGTLSPAKLPGVAKDRPDVLAWPIAMWATNTTAVNSADHIAAGAMSLCAWANATSGVVYDGDQGAVIDLGGLRGMADFVLASCFNLWTEYEARYPDHHLDPGPAPGEDLELSIRVL